MRVLHVSDCYLPRLGGIELHVRDLAGRQRRAGHQVTVATRTPAEGAPEEPGVLRMDASRWGWLDPGRVDVVHAHVSIVSPFALSAGRHAARAGIPTVVTVHSLWTRAGPLPELARTLWRMPEWPVTWTAVSEQAADPVRTLLGVEVHVVPNAVDLTAWSPFPAPPHAEPPVVISVMRLTGVKRAVPLVRALRRAAEQVDLRATIVGDGPQRPPVERYLRRHGLDRRVRLTGALDRTAIRAELARADVFLAPAHRESFGIAALEARASGMPVLASARSGVASFVEHGRDGLLAETDAQLVEHLVRLLADQGLRERIARHNRRVSPAFGWDQALARNEELYAVAGAAAGGAVVARDRLLRP